MGPLAKLLESVPFLLKRIGLGVGRPVKKDFAGLNFGRLALTLRLFYFADDPN